VRVKRGGKKKKSPKGAEDGHGGEKGVTSAPEKRPGGTKKKRLKINKGTLSWGGGRKPDVPKKKVNQNILMESGRKRGGNTDPQNSLRKKRKRRFLTTMGKFGGKTDVPKTKKRLNCDARRDCLEKLNSRDLRHKKKRTGKEKPWSGTREKAIPGGD